MKQEENETHIVSTLKKCLNLVEMLETHVVGGDDALNNYYTSHNALLRTSIVSAIEIAEHNAVQMPKSKREAQMMKLVAMNYLGEMTL